MKPLPDPDPGEPDHRSPVRYLAWLIRGRLGPLSVGLVLSTVAFVAAALKPAAIGRAIDALAAGDDRALGWSTAAVMGLGVMVAVFGTLRHRFVVANWLWGAYRSVQVTVRHAGRLGATLPRRMATGEVVAIGTSDVGNLGGALQMVIPGFGSAASVAVIAVLLLSVSVRLGLVVIIGVPVMMSLVAILLRLLHTRAQLYRDTSAGLINQAGDIVAGLRILRGVGGEAAFGGRYAASSQRLRAAGVRVAEVDSLLQAAQILLPGGFVVLVTWMGARAVVAGELTLGELVAFYGYAAFLVVPLRTLIETAERLIRGHVAATRVVRLLSVRPEITDPATVVPPPPGNELVDPDSGVRVAPGRLTAIAAADPAEAAAVAERLARFDPLSRATLSGVPLKDLAVAAVRERILLADNDADIFNGPVRDQLDGADLPGAVHAASATDVLEALPQGLDTELRGRGRELSGGQQQRLRLVRALLADPPILVLVEPTSAVDAHTEARIAARLGAARAGRTTAVCTTSPLVLDRADTVLYVEGGRLVAEGTHAELLDRVPAYAATVTRGEDA